MKLFLSKCISKDDLSADMADMGLEDEIDEDEDRPNMRATYMRQLVGWSRYNVPLSSQIHFLPRISKLSRTENSKCSL